MDTKKSKRKKLQMDGPFQVSKNKGCVHTTGQLLKPCNKIESFCSEVEKQLNFWQTYEFTFQIRI